MNKLSSINMLFILLFLASTFHLTSISRSTKSDQWQMIYKSYWKYCFANNKRRYVCKHQEMRVEIIVWNGHNFAWTIFSIIYLRGNLNFFHREKNYPGEDKKLCPFSSLFAPRPFLPFSPQFYSLLSETRETFARQRSRGLTDKSYINFQDASRTLKNMQTTLFTRHSVREQRVFRFLSEQLGSVGWIGHSQ